MWEFLRLSVMGVVVGMNGVGRGASSALLSTLDAGSGSISQGNATYSNFQLWRDDAGLDGGGDGQHGRIGELGDHVHADQRDVDGGGWEFGDHVSRIVFDADGVDDAGPGGDGDGEHGVERGGDDQ